MIDNVYAGSILFPYLPFISEVLDPSSDDHQDLILVISSTRYQGKPFNIMVIQVYAPNSNTEEAEVEWFYEDQQNRLELTLKKDVLFIIRGWNAQVGSQETPGK